MKTLYEAQEEIEKIMDPPTQTSLRDWAHVRLISQKEGIEHRKGIYPEYITAEILTVRRMQNEGLTNTQIKNGRLDAISKGLFDKALENEDMDLENFLNTIYKVELEDFIFELAGDKRFSPDRLTLALCWTTFFFKSRKDLKGEKFLPEDVKSHWVENVET